MTGDDSDQQTTDLLCRPLQARSMRSEPHDRVILSELEVSTRYCVQVQISTRNPQPSRKSRLVCESTGKSRDTHAHTHTHGYRLSTQSHRRAPLVVVQKTRLRGWRRW